MQSWTSWTAVGAGVPGGIPKLTAASHRPSLGFYQGPHLTASSQQLTDRPLVSLEILKLRPLVRVLETGICTLKTTSYELRSISLVDGKHMISYKDSHRGLNR